MPPLSAHQIKENYAAQYAQVGKNAIINGDMRIWQRGTSFASVASDDYTLDRWRYGKAGVAVHTITQSTDAPTDQYGYSLKLDCTTADSSVAAGDAVFMRHRIEGYNFRKFVGQTATLSFWIKAGKTGTMCVAFRSGGQDLAYVSEVIIDSANTWEYKTITLDFDYSSGTWYYTNGLGLDLTFTLLSGSTFQTTADAWQNGNYLATSNQTNFCDNTDTTCDIYITGVQLELGSGATDFEFLDFATQLAQCQRYYEKSYNIADAPGTITNNCCIYVPSTRNSGTEERGYDFSVTKRAQPTITHYSPNTGAAGYVYNNGTDRTSIGYNIGTHGIRYIGITGGSTGWFNLHWVADAEL